MSSRTVGAVCASGRREALADRTAIGYDEALALIDGGLSRADAEARTNLRTAQLAKRQRTWFRHQGDAVRLAADAASADELADAMVRTLP
jgi:tRNA dimethylallyltransferase